MKRQLILAIDFDGTIVEDKYPNIGNLRPNAKEVINSLHDDFNVSTILWTCRSGTEFLKAKQFILENDIHIDFFNENTDFVKNHWKTFSPKIYADFFIDDKAIGSTINWEEIFEYLTEYMYKYF